MLRVRTVATRLDGPAEAETKAASGCRAMASPTLCRAAGAAVIHSVVPTGKPMCSGRYSTSMYSAREASSAASLRLTADSERPAASWSSG